MNNYSGNNANTQTVVLQPKLRWFFVVYLLTSIPGLIISLLTIILITTLIGGINSSFNKNGSSNQALETPLNLVNSKKGDEKSKILIYDLKGEILGDSSDSSSSRASNIYVNQVQKDFEQIKQDDTIKNVVFRFNSPGGKVFASEILGDSFNDLLKSKKINTGIYYYDQIAASGVLFATNKSNNYIVASPYGQTGSIGVRLGLPNYAKLADNIGYKETIIKAGSNKDVGNPLRDATTDELNYFQKSVDKTYEEFTSTVAQGRKQDLAKIKSIANGFVYDNNEAKEYGLVDELGSIDNAILKAASNINIKDYSVYKIEPKTSLLQTILSGGNISSMLGLASITNVTDRVSKVTNLKPGVQYMIDENLR